MSDDDLICICMTVSRGEIKDSIQKGNTTVDALKSVLYCCTGCGTCEGRVKAILDEELPKLAAAAQAEPNKAS